MASKKLLLSAMACLSVAASQAPLAARLGKDANAAADERQVLTAPEPDAFGAGSTNDREEDIDASTGIALPLHHVSRPAGERVRRLTELDQELRLQAVLAGYRVGAAARNWPGFHTGMPPIQISAPSFARGGKRGGDWMNQYLAQVHGNGRAGQLTFQYAPARPGRRFAEPRRQDLSIPTAPYGAPDAEIEYLSDPGYTRSTVISVVADAIRYVGEMLRDTFGSGNRSSRDFD